MTAARPLLLVTGSIVVALLGAGCPAGGDDSCQVEGPSPDVDGGLVCGAPFELNEPNGDPGVFGVKIVEYVHVNAAGIVETDTISVLLLLAYVDYHADTLDADVGVQLCQIQIPKVEIPGQPKPTVFQTLPAMLPNIPRVAIKATLSGNTSCESFTSEKAVTVIGACLEDPLGSNLPVDPGSQQCPGVFASPEKDTYCDSRAGCMYDLDLDGEAGATLTADNVPGLDVDLVFATMRSWISMEGMVATSDLILGIAYWSLELVPFGCKLTPMGGGAARYCSPDELKIVAQINPDLSQTANQDSTFMAVRLRPDIDCFELIDRELEIFGR
jgi:hypothetical protein